MAEDTLNKDLISDPRMWRLSLELKADALEVVIHSAVDDNGLIHRTIPISVTDGDLLQALETAIYDNPLLLGDFGKVDFLLSERRFMLVPEAMADEDMRDDMMATLWPGSEYTLVDNRLASSGTDLLMGVDTPLLAFIRRTFPTVRVMHRLTPIITYFYNKDRLNNSTKLYVHLCSNSIDVVMLSNGRIKMTNTFETATVNDMLYFILSIAKNSDFVMDKDELMLCGLPSVREALAPKLRKYVNYVMPVVFPSSVFRAGKEALESPFELIILPLCE